MSVKGRYAIVVDSNSEDELAVVKVTHSQKEPKHQLTVLDGRSNVLPGGLRTKDVSQNPITINKRFEERPDKGTVSKHEVNQIKTMLVNDNRFGERNRKKMRELKKRG
ncbi:MAG: hypothetical protein NC332_04350 [Firmicutes bacterium]|nr:hypothetical protein [Bacillota bacterium]